MTLRVIGAGLGRTGTNSLKLALEQLLGAPCYHMLEVMLHPQHTPSWEAAVRGEAVDWSALLNGYAATVDGSLLNIYVLDATNAEIVSVALGAAKSRSATQRSR